MNLSFSNGRRATDSFSLHHPYDDLSLPTRGLILDIDPEKEGRLEERRENADTLTRYPTYPFAFSTCVQKPQSGGKEERNGEGHGFVWSTSPKNLTFM